MREFYKDNQFGVYKDRQDFRDLKFSDVVAGAPVIDWEKGFELDVLPILKVENQNGSLSCVGQAFSKYAEVLNYYDTGELKDLSAKFIYGQIYLPSGGSFLRDGAKFLVNKGCAEESIVPSYPNTEKDFRALVLDQTILDNAIKYQAKEYRNVSANIDELALAIMTGHGVVSALDGHNAGWQTADVFHPQGQPSWSHAIYFVGFGMRNGKKALKFINSWDITWGDNGFGWVTEDYFKTYEYNGIKFNYAYQGWTIIDKPNKNMIVKKEANSPHIYLIENGKAKKIADWDTFINMGFTEKDIQVVEKITEEKINYSFLGVPKIIE